LAYLATAFLYGADTRSMVLGAIPGKSAPSPAVLAQAVRALDTSSQCIRQGTDLARTTPTTIAGVRDVFAQTYKLAIGCLQDQWEVAYGVGAGLAAFVLGVLDWAITSAKVLLAGLVATFDAITYFGGIQFSVEGPTAKTPAAAPTVTATASTLDAVASQWQTPDGNVLCRGDAVENGVKCVILQFSYHVPAEVQAGREYPCGDGAQIQTGAASAQWACVGDSLVDDPATTPSFPVGTRVQTGDDAVCTILSDGVECKNSAGADFVLTRTHAPIA
jgi:hypothetical protein